MKATLIAAVLMGVASVASAQILYSGGTYTQNFDTLSSDTNTGPFDTGDPWTDNVTLPGWYSNETTYTTDPGILGSGLGLFNHLTSMGTGSERALGTYLGTGSLGAPVIHGLRIENGFGSPMTQFTLSFDIESAISGLSSLTSANVLTAFNLSYSTAASDVSGPGATNYQAVSSSSDLINLNLLGSGSDTRRLELTITNLNIAPGEELWIRFDRSNLLGVLDNSIAIDNVNFNAVPEPGTYIMLGFGLFFLAVLKKKSRPAVVRSERSSMFTLLVMASSASLCQAQFSAPHAPPAEESTPGIFMSIAADDSLAIRNADGQSVQIRKGTKAQRVELPDGACRISYGTNREGESLLVVSPDANQQRPVRFRLGDMIIEVSDDAVATVTLKGDAPQPIVNPGYTGTVKVNGKLLPNLDPAATDASRSRKSQFLYDPEWESATLEKDFATERALDEEKGLVAVINPPGFSKAGPYFLAAVPQKTAPAIVWLRQQSFLRAQNEDGRVLNASYQAGDSPVLMRTLGHRALFGDGYDASRISQQFFKLMPDLFRMTLETRDLLEKVSKGLASPEDLRSLQQTGRVIWLVRCRLVEDLTPPDGDPDPIQDAITESLDVRLVPVATTPF